jgi:gluconolactonase
MDRRSLITALPLVGLAARAAAQPAPPAPGVAPASRPPLPPPTLPITIVAEGLQFPEGPVAMRDGSLLFVEIQRKTVSRLSADGKVSVMAQLEGGPNGLAIGPDGALYIANNGGRFGFRMRDGVNVSGEPEPGAMRGGSIQRLDLKTGKVTTLYDACDGKRFVALDDLVFDHAGGMWISDIGKVPGDGGIYYATADGKHVRQAKGGLRQANGIGLSPDGKQLHVSETPRLWTFDIVGPGVLGPATSYPPEGEHGKLAGRTYADSLKVQADGRVCVCTLFAGGVSIFDKAGGVEFIQSNDVWTTNLAFGGRDMRDVWLTLSGSGRIGKVRWPYPGLKPAYSA